MKLVYIAHIRMPTGRAHGYAVMKMCEEFASSGVGVELLIPARSRGIQEDPFTYYGIRRSFSIRKIWAMDILGALENAPFGFALDILSFLWSLRAERFADDTIVYTRDYLVALTVRAKRIFLEIHDIPGGDRMFLRALRRARGVIVISKGLRDELVRKGIPPETILVAPDAVDHAEFAIQADRSLWREFGVDPDKKIVLYTGHFYEWKGAETLAQAAHLLPKDIDVVLMGGVAQEFEHFKKTYASKNVHIIPIQKRERIAALLKSSDALVLPNSGKSRISSHYTSPLKLFQYMASGIAIIASDLPSIREVLDDSSAFWFEPDNERDLARAIKDALADPSAPEKAARALSEAQKYTWDKRARAILAHVDKFRT